MIISKQDIDMVLNLKIWQTNPQDVSSFLCVA